MKFRKVEFLANIVGNRVVSVYKESFNEEDVFRRIFQAYPQLILQGFTVLYGREPTIVQLLSMLISLCNLANAGIQLDTVDTGIEKKSSLILYDSTL